MNGSGLSPRALATWILGTLAGLTTLGMWWTIPEHPKHVHAELRVPPSQACSSPRSVVTGHRRRGLCSERALSCRLPTMPPFRLKLKTSGPLTPILHTPHNQCIGGQQHAGLRCASRTWPHAPARRPLTACSVILAVTDPVTGRQSPSLCRVWRGFRSCPSGSPGHPRDR